MFVRRVRDALRISAELAWLLRSRRWDARRIAAYQNAQVAAQLRYALAHIPYYRELGIEPASIRGCADLPRFPKLTKRIVQQAAARLCNPAVMAGRVFSSTTSGTSGEPTTTWFDERSWLLCKYALKLRRMAQAGHVLRQRVLILDESPVAEVGVNGLAVSGYPLARTLRMSVFTPPAVQYAALADFQPTVIYGTPSGVKELCDHAARERLPLPRVETVFLSSELIVEELRRRLRAELGARVRGVYGSTEFKEVAFECPHGRYHINFESVYIEIEPGEGASGLLITSLVNKAMPLIRFDIGDHAELAVGPCPCGLQSPGLTDIAGREAEFVELADGRRVSPYLLTTAVESTPGLLKYQFRQRADAGLQLHVVLSQQPPEEAAALEEIARRVRRALGDDVVIDVRRVSSIARTGAGKHRLVVAGEA